VTDVLAGRHLEAGHESGGTVFSSLTAARGYADLVLDQVMIGAMTDTIMVTVTRLQEALREHERRMRIICGLAEVT
jgi:hypothetical protein